MQEEERWEKCCMEQHNQKYVKQRYDDGVGKWIEALCRRGSMCRSAVYLYEFGVEWT